MEVSIPQTTPLSTNRFSLLLRKFPGGVFGFALVAFLLLIALFFGFSYMSSLRVTRTISSIGNGKVRFQAKTAELTILLVNRGANKLDLTNNSKKEFAGVVDNLQRLQVDSVSQSAPQVVPLSASTTTDGQSVFNSFEYRQAAVVTVSSDEKIQSVFDFLSGQNVVVAQTQYLPPEQSQVSEQLLKAALDDATAKANQLAKSSHLRLGRILSIAEVTGAQDNSGLVSLKNSSSSNTQLANAPDSSQIELRKTISVTFELQ
jgi:uncharacterized protein YggE